MSSLKKFRLLNVLKCASLQCRESNFASSRSNLYVNGLYSPPIFMRPRFCTTVNSKNVGNLCELAKKSISVRKRAQAIFLEYLQYTRNFHFLDAENMSGNTPEYFEKLLKKVEIDGGDIGKSFTRFLSYHPINEFEPFFESIGLSPSKYSSFLPRNSMFLHDEKVLLENYYVLCNYGIARSMIGKIYMGAGEFFQYDHSVLHEKLQSFEKLGLTQSFIGKIVTSSPHLLRGEENSEFLEVLENLKKVGIGYDWLEKHISDMDFYRWKRILDVILFLCDVGVKEKQLGELIKQHPDMLLERSGGISTDLLGFFLKFGLSQIDIRTIFLHFPKISVVKFKKNLCRSYEFLVQLEMDIYDIGKTAHSNMLLLGSCEIKKAKSLLTILNCGAEQVCQMIIDDPNVLKAWVLGNKVDRLPPQEWIQESKNLKFSFLLKLGFVENSKEMRRALTLFRGKGFELQERFDYLVSTGLSHEEVAEMVKKYPHILNSSSEITKRKISLFVDLGYSVSSLVTHPTTISYAVQRVKSRLLAYQWLRKEGVLRRKLGLSTLLACSEKVFIKNWVNSHPRGLEFWERLKKEVYSN